MNKAFETMFSDSGSAQAISELSADVTVKASQTVINADVGLAKWRNKKAKAATGSLIANINFIGTSFTRGEGASDAQTKSFFALCRAAFIAKYGDAGEGFVPIYGYSDDARYTFTGSWNQDYAYGIANKGYSSAEANASFTFEFTGTGVDIVYTRMPSGASASCVVDGGAPATLETANAFAQTTTFTITGLSAGEHTLVVTKSNDTNRIYISGCTPKNAATAGIRCNMMGRSSATAADGAVAGSIPPETHNSPDLTIIEYLANDTPTDLTAYSASIQTIITAAKLTGDVVLLATCIAAATAENVLSHIAVLEDLAVTNSCALINVFKRWGNTLAGGALYTADFVHPADAGGYDIKEALMSVID